MPRTNTAGFRLSVLTLAVFTALPAFAKDEQMTVVATGNQRSTFEAPMMVSVIDANSPESQTSTSAADMLRKVPGITLDGTGRTNGQDINMRGYDRRGILILGGRCSSGDRYRPPEQHLPRPGADQAH
ncbi:TonB-dependent receptor plug domain-containing protein [Cedecea lapagei]|uniref:TonB-dependent receptor plug domain-containing protein n=1 Tax=Cedecea lapagei TaxID=158823 RepID=UPI002F92E058